MNSVVFSSFKNAIVYGLRRQQWLVLGLLVILLASSVVVLPWKLSDSNADWFSGFDVVLTITTLGIAILVWLGEMRQEWESQLPKRLNALFYFENRLVMRCLNAPLASEGDIRAWAQQLGAQMANTKFLGLQPRFETGSRIDFAQDGSAVRLYEIKMYLSEMPDEIQKKLDEATKQTNHSPRSRVIVQMDPFSESLDPRVVELQD